jgi:hypothetical protein
LGKDEHNQKENVVAECVSCLFDELYSLYEKYGPQLISSDYTLKEKDVFYEKMFGILNCLDSSYSQIVNHKDLSNYCKDLSMLFGNNPIKGQSYFTGGRLFLTQCGFGIDYHSNPRDIVFPKNDTYHALEQIVAKRGHKNPVCFWTVIYWHNAS